MVVVQVNTKSLEDVIRRYLALAEEKTEEARLESHQSVVDVDDLDVLQTPERSAPHRYLMIYLLLYSFGWIC
jgi:hypothetical protein